MLYPNVHSLSCCLSSLCFFLLLYVLFFVIWHLSSVSDFGKRSSRPTNARSSWLCVVGHCSSPFIVVLWLWIGSSASLVRVLPNAGEFRLLRWLVHRLQSFFVISSFAEMSPGTRVLNWLCCVEVQSNIAAIHRTPGLKLDRGISKI